MTNPDDRNGDVEDRRRELRRVVRAVRATSHPATSDIATSAGAADRIADAAWNCARPSTTSTSKRPFLSTVFASSLRRWVAAAVILTAVGASTFVLRPTEAAFAIDGDPVQVLRGDRWESETRFVHPGATIFVQGGVRTLRGPGAEITPEPGSTFRIVGDGDAQSFRLEILGGGAEISGKSIRLVVADFDMQPTLTSRIARVFASVPAPISGAPSPELALTTDRLKQVRFEVRLGDVRVTRRSTGEHIDLSDTDVATLLPVPTDGTHVFRLARLREYTPNVAMRIAMGHPVIDMHQDAAGAIAVLAGPGNAVTGFAIRGDELPFALDDMYQGMLTFVTQLNVTQTGLVGPAHPHAGGVGRDPEMRSGVVAWQTSGGPIDALIRLEQLEDRAVESRQTLTECVRVENGQRVRVVVIQDGTVLVERNGVERTYASRADARAADPEALAPLANFLGAE